MTDQTTTDTDEPRGLVRFAGREYPLITELTEREKFEAERMTGVGLDEIKAYTSALVLAFFTLKRAAIEHDGEGARITWDWFLDKSGIEFVTEQEANGGPPPTADALDPGSVGETTATTGTPDSPPSSESTPGT